MHISSYLGIERQSLSRIRSKILSQKWHICNWKYLYFYKWIV
jgi:hypothetical protein